MKSVLEELYLGNIRPNEQIVPCNPAYRPLGRRISGLIQLWQKKLCPEEYEQLEQLLNLRHEMAAMEMEASFIHGFQMGVRMMVESLDTKKERPPAAGDVH